MTDDTKDVTQDVDWIDAASEDTGASQLDVATSFLAILLLYFVIMVVAVTGAGSGRVNTNYIREEADSAPANLRTFRYVYPFREIWLVQYGKVARVHLARIAERIALDASNPSEATFEDGTKVVVDLGKAAPSTFVLRILRPRSNAPPLANIGPFDIVRPLEANMPVDQFGVGALFLVWREDLASAFSLFDTLQRSGRNPRISEVNDDCEGKWCPGIRRDAEAFGIEEMFR